MYILRSDTGKHWNKHCVKNVRIQSYSGPYPVRMRENSDQKNSEYGDFSCSKTEPLVSNGLK